MPTHCTTDILDSDRRLLRGDSACGGGLRDDAIAFLDFIIGQSRYVVSEECKVRSESGDGSRFLPRSPTANKASHPTTTSLFLGGVGLLRWSGIVFHGCLVLWWWWMDSAFCYKSKTKTYV
jgi:hypothetical protein